MKKIIIFICVAFLIVYVFLKSGAWETYKIENDSRGVPYIETKYRLNWDNLIIYLKNLPKSIIEGLKSKN